MLTFLLDNIGTIVVLLIVVAVVAAIIISHFRAKKKGQIFLWQLWLRMCILCNGR